MTDPQIVASWAPAVRDRLLSRGVHFWRWGKDTPRQHDMFVGQCLTALSDLDFEPTDGKWQRWGEGVADYLAKMGPLSPYLQDPDLTDFQVRGRRARLIGPKCVKDLGLALAPDEALGMAYRLAILAGARLDVEQPRAVVELPDGAGRATLIIPPLVEPDEVVIEVRRPSMVLQTLDDLIGIGTLTQDMADFLSLVVPTATTLIAGGKGSGKTTLLSILTGVLPGSLTMTVIESPFRELVVRHPWTTRVVVPPGSAVTAEEMIWQVGSRLPGGMIVGEVVKEGEARQWMEVVRLGTRPALATLHAGAPETILSSLEQKVYGETGRSYADVIAANVDLLVYMRQVGHARILTDIIGVDGYDSDGYLTTPIFTYVPEMGIWQRSAGGSPRLGELQRWSR